MYYDTRTYRDPVYAENAFLMEGFTGDRAYYVLTHLQAYGNTILTDKFVNKYGFDECKSALENLLNISVEIRKPKYNNDQDFYVVSVSNGKHQDIEIPPTVSDYDFKVFTRIFVHNGLLQRSQNERTFYAVVNGDKPTAELSFSHYSATILADKTRITNIDTRQSLWISNKEIIKELEQ